MRGKTLSKLLAALLVAGAAAGWWMKSRPPRPLQPPLDDRGHQGYQRLEGCRWIEHGANDGDSFHVRLPDGSRMHIRLYYVDAPETSYKRYDDGNDNAKRLHYQAKYFGSLSRKRITAVGREARGWVKHTLADRAFTIITNRELVFGGPRVFAFVELAEDGRRRYLHELLVEEGMARIYTRGSRMPDGTSVARQEARLRKLERAARREGRGGWER